MKTTIRNIQYYQSANLSDREIKQLFVVRQKEFQRIMFESEEQAGIYRLHDLWDLILSELEIKGFQVEKINWEDYSDDLISYSQALYANIQKALKSKNKKMLLLLDNIDRIFDNIGKDAHLLRELLTNYKDLRIIGGSTRMSEHHWKYDKPFYQFFSLE